MIVRSKANRILEEHDQSIEIFSILLFKKDSLSSFLWFNPYYSYRMLLLL